jgi:predicted aldo/keto reductase-like oxidoreductase
LRHKESTRVIYRVLGRTGLKVSQLGFGAMRLPMVGKDKDAKVNLDLAVPMMRRAFELGVNYIDTAVFYCNEDSQRAVGVALKGWRDKVVLSTKNHDYGQDEKAWWTNLENSLCRLDVQCIDIYNHHGINWKKYTQDVEPRVGKWMAKAKDQGLIRHICASFHDNNEGLVNLVNSGYASVITLQYNLLDRQLEGGIALAKQKGIGIVVMGPVGGGRLGSPSDVLGSLVPGVARVPELALRFVLANPNVTLALSGMSTIEQVQESCRIAADEAALSPADVTLIDEHLAKLKAMADLYCTGCRYCLPCPASVEIPRVFDFYNRARVYGLWDWAAKAYSRMGKSDWDKGKLPASACTDCGACESKCPQKLPIRKQLKEANEALTAALKDKQ